MDINFLIKGIVIGFSIAAPVGPIGIFRKKIKSNILGWVNRISGSIIIGFALMIFTSLIKNIL